MKASSQRALEILDSIEALLNELRDELHRLPPETAPEPRQRNVVEAFADETFRARDA